jgi:hypothetical protein
MKTLFASLLLLPALVFSQNSNELVRQIPFTNYCVPMESLEQYLGQYDELPLLRGRSVRTIGEKQFEHVMVFYFNRETKTWTIVERIGEDMFCIIGAGNSSELMPTDVVKEIQNQRLRKRS